MQSTEPSWPQLPSNVSYDVNGGPFREEVVGVPPFPSTRIHICAFVNSTIHGRVALPQFMPRGFLIFFLILSV